MLQCIRKASPEDLTKMSEIYNKVLIEDDLSWDKKTYLMRLSECTLIAEVESVGVIGWIMIDDSLYHQDIFGVGVVRIYIATEYRGNGVGKHLLSELIEHAQLVDCTKLMAYVLEEDIVGQKLYKSAGFRTVGALLKHIRWNSSYKNVVIMEKLIEKD